MTAMTEIGGKRLDDLLLVIHQNGNGSVDPVDAALGAGRAFRDMSRLLLVENGTD